jgi:AGCS family alanine or glycine:cation symporter
MQTFTAWMSALNSFVWGPAMLVLILGTGFFLQLRLRAMPIRHIGSGLRTAWHGRNGDGADHGDITPLAALMTTLAATVGVGNIAGVATAIALGGPGAVFWMWMTALVGMATKYAEVVLAVHFRERDERGRWVGGPMYAIRRGLGRRWAWLGSVFALFGGLAGFGIGNMVQANSIAAALETSFGIRPSTTGVVLLLLTGAVLLGGIRRIAAVSSWLVPFMAVAYLVAAFAVLVTHAANVPRAFMTIVVQAFTPTAAVGGFAGAAVMAGIRYGVARGVFSNEAGLGTAGIAQAAGMSLSPVRSGLVGMMGTFIDTIVICSLTALAIVASGAWTTGKTGAELTQVAFQSAFPVFGDEVVAVALTVFALTTILGWSYYGERCWQFLAGPRSIRPYRVLWSVAVFFGAVTQLDLAWMIADTLNGLMAVPNLIALLALSPIVVQLTWKQLPTALAQRHRSPHGGH